MLARDTPPSQLSPALAVASLRMRAYRRLRPALSMMLLAVLLVGCGRFTGQAPEGKPGVDPNSTLEPMPTAVRPLVGACPTLAEAKVAVPSITRGPDANDSPFKNMVLQCTYVLPGLDLQFHPNGIGILVFDATAEGKTLWNNVRTDPSFPNATDIPGLGEVGFRTGTPGHKDLDLWVVQGGYGFHMLGADGISLDQMVALARAMLAGLDRLG